MSCNPIMDKWYGKTVTDSVKIVNGLNKSLKKSEKNRKSGIDKKRERCYIFLEVRYN